jgi:hypothetical protein
MRQQLNNRSFRAGAKAHIRGRVSDRAVPRSLTETGERPYSARMIDAATISIARRRRTIAVRAEICV